MREYQIPGLQLGVRYTSGIVLDDGSVAPPEVPNHYEPGAWPGSRAPHARIGASGDKVLFDRFGRDFTVLCPAEDGPAWRDAAEASGLPLAVLPWPDEAVRTLYGAAAGRAAGGADAVLIRPDHHVAWRGPTGSAAERMDILAVVSGRKG